MIDIRKLKELVRLMVDNDLIEIDLRDSEEQVTMRRPNPNAPPQMIASPQHLMQPMHAMPQVAHAPVNGAAPAAAGGGGGSGGAGDDESKFLKIESPMVGTFYATPNPDSPPFAGVGTAVSADKVVCIIEAMKIFNEIKAECSGTIHKVMVKSGDPVEFGQVLFLVKPG